MAAARGSSGLVGVLQGSGPRGYHLDPVPGAVLQPPRPSRCDEDEFLALNQGTMTVMEYRDCFLQLARYAPAKVADDREKQEHFMEGLNDYLKYALLNLRFDDFNHLVDAALNTVRKHREKEVRKRKFAPAASDSNIHPRFQPPQQQQHWPPQQYQQRPQ